MPTQSATVEDIRNSILYSMNELKLTDATIHSRINAIKLYCVQVKKEAVFYLKFLDQKAKNCPKLLLLSTS